MAIAFLQLHYANGNIEVRSVGIQAVPGTRLHPLTRMVLEEQGLRCQHRVQGIDQGSLAWADLILTMTRSQKFALIRRMPMIADKIYTFNAYLGNPIHDILAPAEENIQAYKEKAFEIEAACTLLYQILQEDASADEI
jgi:protein-tyrosine-phosphatase